LKVSGNPVELLDCREATSDAADVEAAVLEFVTADAADDTVVDRLVAVEDAVVDTDAA